MSIRLKSFLIVAFCLIQYSFGLYKDEIGTYDWHKELIGKVSFVDFKKSPKQRPLTLTVATNKNIIASLNHKSGSINWRQQVDNLIYTNMIDDYLLTVSLVYTVPVIRLWDTASGFIIFEYPLQGYTTTSKNIDITSLSGPGKQMTVSIGDWIVILDKYRGTLISSWKPSKFQASVSLIYSNDSKMYGLGYDVESKSPIYFEFDNDGIIDSSKTKLDNGFEDHFVLNDASGKSRVILNHKTGYSVLGEKSTKQATSTNKLSDDTFMVLSNGKVQISQIESDGSVTVLNEFSNSESTSNHYSITNFDKNTYVGKLFSSPNCKNSIGRFCKEFTLYQLGKSEPIYTIKLYEEFSTSPVVDQIDLTIFGIDSSNMRLIVRSTDGAIRYYKGDSNVWTREEYLTDIIGSEFVDLPEENLLSEEHDELDEPSEETESITPVDRYIRRWKSHIHKLQNYIVDLAFNPSKFPLLSTIFGTSGVNSTSLVKDPFGFKKLLVVGTRNGVVLGINTLTGEPAWRTYVGDIGNGKLRNLYLLRATSIKYPPVVGFLVDSDESETIIARYNAIDGNVYSADGVESVYTFPTQAKQVFKLSLEEHADRTHILAIMSSQDDRVYLYPNTLDSFAAVESKNGLDSFRYFLTDGVGSDSITGYSLVPRTTKDQFYSSKQMWKYTAKKGEKIAAFNSEFGDGNVSSLGRVLGSRSVLYKYLNPNILAFATLRGEDSVKTSVSINLLDTITGSLYYSGLVDGAGPLNIDSSLSIEEQLNGSIHIRQSENWVVATYFNHGPKAAFQERFGPKEESGEKHKRLNKKKKAEKEAEELAKPPNSRESEVFVLEVFEDSRPDHRIKSSNFSSFGSIRPHIESKAYSIPFAVNAIGVTKTHNSITSREVIFSTSSDQLFIVNKRVLDPRRPKDPTAQDKEEGLIPYKPNIDFNPKDVPSYYQRILGTKKIVSSPSSLESTSLVCSYGIDMFFTRRSPSQKFDVLSESFSRVGLIVTVIGLVIGIRVSKQMVLRKKLRESWK